MQSLLFHQFGGWALVFARVSGAFWSAPALGSSSLGMRMRLILALMTTAIVAPLTGSLGFGVGGGEGGFDGLGGWASMATAEFVVGLALGLSAGLIVAAARQAGELIATIAGLSPASLFDPEADTQLTPLGHLFGWLALGLFLAQRGPMAIIKAIVESYQVLPLGGLALDRRPTLWVFGKVADALALSLQAAAPVALALVIASIVLALVSRSAPSLALWSLAMPARLCVALVVALVGLGGIAMTIGSAWKAWPGTLF